MRKCCFMNSSSEHQLPCMGLTSILAGILPMSTPQSLRMSSIASMFRTAQYVPDCKGQDQQRTVSSNLSAPGWSAQLHVGVAPLAAGIPKIILRIRKNNFASCGSVRAIPDTIPCVSVRAQKQSFCVTVGSQAPFRAESCASVRFRAGPKSRRIVRNRAPSCGK